MRFDLTSLIVGVLLGTMFTVAIARPASGRLLARVAGVALLAGGLAFVVWAFLTDVRDDVLRSPFGGNLITQVGEAYAWGVGVGVAGVVALVLSYRGRRPEPDETAPD